MDSSEFLLLNKAVREQADLAIDLALPVVLITNVLAQHCHVLRERDDTETKILVFLRPVQCNTNYST